GGGDVCFLRLLGVVIASAMKIVGTLLLRWRLIMPAASARRFAATPAMMAVVAAGAGALAVVGGLNASLQFDTPSGPSIVVAALVLFLLSIVRLPWRSKQQSM